MIALTETGGSQPATLAHLEPLCRDYDAQCINLEMMIADLEADLARVKQTHLRKLKVQAGVVARREAELHQAIESSPDLFKKPRTVVMHGTKIGFLTSKGAVDFDDEAAVIKLVRKHLAERFDELVKTKETARKDNLRNLTTAELAKIGCRIEGAGDAVVLTRVAGDVEKLMDKLIEKLVGGMVEADS